MVSFSQADRLMYEQYVYTGYVVVVVVVKMSRRRRIICYSFPFTTMVLRNKKTPSYQLRLNIFILFFVFSNNNSIFAANYCENLSI